MSFSTRWDLCGNNQKSSASRDLNYRKLYMLLQHTFQLFVTVSWLFMCWRLYVLTSKLERYDLYFLVNPLILFVSECQEKKCGALYFFMSVYVVSIPSYVLRMFTASACFINSINLAKIHTEASPKLSIRKNIYKTSKHCCYFDQFDF